MLLSLLASAAFAWSTVVAVGEGRPEDPADREPAEPEPAEALPGGWVAVLADCLEERQPRRWSVVDRAAADPEGDLTDLRPSVVVLGLGGPDLAVAAGDERSLRPRLERRIAALRVGGEGPGLLLVGPVRVESARVRREELDRVMAELADRHEGVYHLDPVKEGPLGGPPTLSEDGALTWQGHARVAAAVCDAILGHWPAAR